MRIRTSAGALAIIIGLLALPAGATAGGWATVGLSSTPDDVKPGATWNVDIEVLQHGRTPLDAVHPTVTITSGDVSAAAGSTGGPGPALDALLPAYDASSLRAKIVDPYPAGTGEYFATMPQDFGSRMRDRELDDLVEFLLGATSD